MEEEQEEEEDEDVMMKMMRTEMTLLISDGGESHLSSPIKANPTRVKGVRRQLWLTTPRKPFILVGKAFGVLCRSDSHGIIAFQFTNIY